MTPLSLPSDFPLCCLVASAVTFQSHGFYDFLPLLTAHHGRAIKVTFTAPSSPRFISGPERGAPGWKYWALGKCLKFSPGRKQWENSQCSRKRGTGWKEGVLKWEMCIKEETRGLEKGTGQCRDGNQTRALLIVKPRYSVYGCYRHYRPAVNNSRSTTGIVHSTSSLLNTLVLTALTSLRLLELFFLEPTDLGPWGTILSLS